MESEYTITPWDIIIDWDRMDLLLMDGRMDEIKFYLEGDFSPRMVERILVLIEERINNGKSRNLLRS